MQKTINALVFAGLALCLLQIWLPAYYLTGDGPCHLYNAQILHDLWTLNKDTAFYHRFYNVVYQPDPNWLSTIALALLLLIVKGVIAEKILLTLYTIVFVSGFYSMLRKISAGRSYWVLAVFIFVFPHELAKGFYNSSFSIAFYFWAVWSWLMFLEKRSATNAITFFLFTALVYFTHLLAFGFEAFTCAALVISHAMANHKKFIGGYLAGFTAWLSLFLAPFIILMFAFTKKEGGLQLSLEHHFYRLVELAQFKYLVNITTRENIFALISGITILLLFGYTFLKVRIRSGVGRYDGLLLSLLFAMLVYICFPESFLGRLILINMRVQPIVGALLACCIAYMLPDNKIKTAGGFLLFGCFVCLTVVRINCMLVASKATEDYVSVKERIRPYTVVLPLNFAPSGKDGNGQVITNWNYSFSHAADYIGLNKPVIMLDNYEANMGYFPVRWNKQVNPYSYLDKYEGTENVPPCADINAYKRTTGADIDYILFWCYDSSFLQNAHFRMLYEQIIAGYHIAYASPSKQTVLYELNAP